MKRKTKLPAHERPEKCFLVHITTNLIGCQATTDFLSNKNATQKTPKDASPTPNQLK